MNVEEYLYIDYENVQDVKVDVIKKTTKVKIILGNDQTKIPVDLVTKTQPFGEMVEWVQVAGKGRNALDFFIVYFIGRDATLDKGKSFIIYSKDTGFDPLISHLKKSGIKAKRIVSFQEVGSAKNPPVEEVSLSKVLENLRKIGTRSSPKKRKTLTTHIAAQLKDKKPKEIENIIEHLFIKGIVYEENGLLKYKLEKGQ
ncbi:MAG: hypothetical protein CVU85_08445 [Firmicutes bacterium HGW-Firmicutes-10]|jgi:hypothetical protein|nr:MAG: hypothetical protein CVU85_08445 [Firmicutes bacterium HGW-Firmicutes-10]